MIRRPVEHIGNDGKTFFDMRSEIGFSVLVLARKAWGRTLIDGKIRSERWWRQRLEYLINKEEDPIPPENLWDGKPAEPVTMPYEITNQGWTVEQFETYYQIKLENFLH